MRNGRRHGDVLKGLVAGLAGGLVASWTMNQFQAAWTKATEDFEKPQGAQSMQPLAKENSLAKVRHRVVKARMTTVNQS